MSTFKRLFSLLLATILLFSHAVFAASELQNKEKPIIQISGGNVYSAKPGEKIRVSVDLSNVGNDWATEIHGMISPSPDGAVYPYGSSSDYIRDIRSGDGYSRERSMSFDLMVDPKAEGGVKKLPLRITYQDSLKEQTFELTAEVIVRVESVPQSSVLATNRLDIVPSNIIQPGQEFIVGLEVENIGEQNVYDVQATLEGLKENNVILMQGLNTQTFPVLGKGDKKYITFYLKADNQAKSGSRELKYTLSYAGSKEKQANSSSIFFTIGNNGNGASNLVIENLTYPKGTMGINQTATVSFDVRNQGNSNAKNVTVKAEMAEQGGLVSKTVSTFKELSIAPGEIKHYDFQFFSTEATATKNYPINITVTSQEDPNDESTKSTVNQFVGIFVKGKNADDPNAPKSTPKLILDKYRFDPQLVRAGQNFKMYLSFYNTNATKAVRNIKIFLTSESGSTNQKAENASSSVFTPVDSSNTFYIDSIPPKGKVEKEITMFTIPDAIAKTHIITANFEYEDNNSNPFTAKELIGVPVIQESKMEIGDLTYNQNVQTGEDVSVSATFYNTGKVTLYNLMVRLEGENFKSNNAQYYVGNFSSGATENFEGSFYVEEPGEHKGKLVFTYEDSSGATQSIEKEISVTAEEMRTEPELDENGNPIYPGMPDGKNPEGNDGKSLVKNPIFWIIIVGVGIVVTVVIRKIRKKKKEKELSIDE